jgi:death on curing protein
MIKENNCYYLDLIDFDILVTQLRDANEEFSKDLPPFSTRYEGRLESIIDHIKANYFGQELYPSVEEKASWLFYLINKNHPFLNGNKRIAVMAYYVFMTMNFMEIYFDEETITNELYEIATITASSLPEEKDEVLEMLLVKAKQYTHFK